ncbi:family 43 glycosylhydrolase [Paenibacillus albidus]|uniref:glycoside hydrolase family 43 protein n=1 Tax=Paenibacillus albidus TaxID=2041023 RepID=UPI001BEC2CB3|nr:glycoside hydrolase family 43 protein [Paenibacillus albidus]MBT2289576.1 family 43 glycosylhydrolase [Paenibacillus albidus]
MIKNVSLQIRDPFVLPVKREGLYYLFGSTDSNIWGRGTGFDVYTGTDLEHWEGPFAAFRPGPDFYAEKNFWAPEVYEYNGRYFMFATFRRKDNELLGTAVLSAAHPLGPFLPHSEGPVTPVGWSSLDGTLYVDEQQQPWMIFCHEWQQTGDGEICAMRLSGDLRQAADKPLVLFRGSQAPWTTPYRSIKYQGQENYVTDGPFLFRADDGTLYLLWASFINNTYALGIAHSEGGGVAGPWIHQKQPLFHQDGGHGMVFRTFENKLMLAVHSPNQTPDERPFFLEFIEEKGQWKTAE